jgi:hypothetical protein
LQYNFDHGQRKDGVYLIGEIMRAAIVFVIACYADIYRPATLLIWDRPTLSLRGGSPDLGLSTLDGDLLHSHMQSLRSVKDLAVGVREGRYSVTDAKHRAEFLLMGSNPMESSSILEVGLRCQRISI